LVGIGWETSQAFSKYSASSFRNEDLLSNGIGAQSNLTNLLSPVNISQIIYNRIVSYGTPVDEKTFKESYEIK
jgi:hypothetical protein